MKYYRSILLAALLIGILVSSISIYNIESKARVLNNEIIELSKIKYGIFNVDEWKAALSSIIIKRINDFELEPTKEEDLREKITVFLGKAIDELEKSFFEYNSGSIKGFFKGSVANITGVYDVMRKDIPLLTESIIGFIKDPDNKNLAQDFILEKLDEYSDKTFSEVDYTLLNIILKKHNAPTRIVAVSTIQAAIDELTAQKRPYIIAIFSIIILLFIAVAFNNNFSQLDFLLLTLTCGVLLIVGVLLPMINIDARISNMEFSLLGENIQFKDQVLYFKSKSILEVVRLMLVSSKTDVLAVGILVFIFSVILPITKLISSLIYIYSEKAQQNSWLKFLVFKISKWSMADVMVVAIFMAYIGFSGIISDQLAGIESITEHLDIMTTNASSLQIGFFLFTSFAVLGLLTSHKIKYHFLKADAIEG